MITMDQTRITGANWNKYARENVERMLVGSSIEPSSPEPLEEVTVVDRGGFLVATVRCNVLLRENRYGIAGIGWDIVTEYAVILNGPDSETKMPLGLTGIVEGALATLTVARKGPGQDATYIKFFPNEADHRRTVCEANGASRYLGMQPEEAVPKFLEDLTAAAGAEKAPK